MIAKPAGRIKTRIIDKATRQQAAYIVANGIESDPIYTGSVGESRAQVVKKAKHRMKGNWMRKDIVAVLMSEPST